MPPIGPSRLRHDGPVADSVIRPRRSGDVRRCVAILRRIHREDGYPTYWPKDPERFVAPPYERAAWVAELDGVVVGHIALHDASQDPAYAMAATAAGDAGAPLVAVGRLFTSCEHRRSGVGKDLLDQAVGAAHDEERRPFLNVVQRLTNAVARYERSGWTNLGPFSITFANGNSLELFAFLGPPPP